MNNKCKFLIVFSLVFIFATFCVQAEKYKGTIVVQNSPKGSTSCFPPAKNTELKLNNVRAFLKTNGTMWFDESAEYEVPKGSGKMSMFSSALWIGGKDANGQLYVAAMTFGQRGNDFWTGPLKMKDGSIDPGTCSYYDKFFRMTRIEVEKHIAALDPRNPDPTYVVPQSILEWPANPRNSNTGQSQFLAPFKKVGGGDPNVYEPLSGDYPYYDLSNELCPWTIQNKERAKICPWLDKDAAEGGVCDPNGRIPNPKALPMPPERIWTRQQQKDYGWDNLMIYADHVLKGDETVFWFLNDAGGSHGESKSIASIGLEIRAQAFAFSTNNELNKMTFYSYEIINRGSVTLSNTFFSQWVDPDLGYALDDYVGCDVNRGLGYCYNGTEVDGTGQLWAYGANPPAVGVDFFQGPYIDPDGADNPAFDKEQANILGNINQQEYCKRFVHYIFDKFDVNDPNLYDKYVQMNITGFKQPQILRWNDQFAINGVNFGDGIVDNERFGMRRFVFHDNKDTPYGDPQIAPEFYQMLQGIWRNNLPMTYGGNAYQSSDLECNFMFPGNTDYCNWGTKGVEPDAIKFLKGGRKGTWTEREPNGIGSPSNEPYDRRFMHSAGPFELRQGACNYITVGIPWARATQGGVEAAIKLLMVADDKCQALFENCFKLIDGPDAPILTIREYDKRLIFLLTNDPNGNNANEDYKEVDAQIPEAKLLPWIDSASVDRFYRFEGYQIYQVTGPEVGANDLDNPDLARLVRQFDIVNYDKNGNPIGTLINWEFDEKMQLPVPVTKVEGANTGILHSFEVTKDLFARENEELVNYKTYYFIAVAYAYNQFWPFSIDKDFEHGLEGQQLPYLRGRKTGPSMGGGSVVPIPGVPHPSSLHFGTNTLNSDYGSIPNIIRIDGQGNGGIALELTQETINKIVSGGDNNDYRVRELKYEKNAGPLKVKVIDPLRVKPFDFTLVIMDSVVEKVKAGLLPLEAINKLDVSDDAYWVLTIDESIPDKDIIAAGLGKNNDKEAIRQFPCAEYPFNTSLKLHQEQIIMPLGISVTIKNEDFVATQPKVIENWKKILDSWSSIPPLPPAIPKKEHRDYKAKLLYGQPLKIEMANDVVFSDNGPRWITGLVNDVGGLPSHWIRAGNYNLGTWKSYNAATKTQVWKIYDLWRLEDAFFPTSLITKPSEHGKSDEDRAFKDFTGRFATLCGGTWAPYVLTSPYDGGPQAKYIAPEPICDSEGLSIYDSNGLLQEPKERYYDFQKMQTYPSPPYQPGYNTTITNLYSVNVVLTPNKDLWTRCIILESCSDPNKSIGGALKNEPRKSKSVGKDGKPDNSTDGFGENGDEGMGWFPGYAINIETGERLNIMFSENSDTTLAKFSRLVNGNDMVFNPTSAYAIATKDTLVELYMFGTRQFLPLEAGMIIPQAFYNELFTNNDNFTGKLQSIGIIRIWGGMHYVYVCGSSGNTCSIHNYSRGVVPNLLATPGRNFNLDDTTFYISGNPKPVIHGGFIDKETKKYPIFDLGPYDEGKWLVQKFKQFLGEVPGNEIKKFKMQLFNNVMYTYIPMQPFAPELQKEWLSCDVTFKIRVTRPYWRYISRWYESPERRDKDYSVPDEFNYFGYPVYKLSTKELAPTKDDTRLFKSTLDKINIVPNPYYGGSFYEKNALDTKVKITNLPTDLKNNSPITINIFTVNGILVRTLTKGDAATTYVDWDLKNYANIPIAGGVYIIHVNCPGIGERMLKFFCTMRPTDLNTF